MTVILGFITAKFSYVIFLCESLHFVLYAWSSYFAMILRKYYKITQIQNGR